MKKKMYAAMALVGITAGLLAGCGQSGGGTSTAGTMAAEPAGTAGSTQEAAQDEKKSTAGDSTGSLEGTEMNLYTWDGMFPRSVLDGFEERYGVRINYSNFDYDEDMLAKLEETKGGGYDFVIADDYILELVKSEGLAKDLDKERISNWSNINPVFQGQFYDPTDSFTMPYGAGIPLIVYDPAVVDVEIEGYEDLWNASLEDNVALIGNYRVINGITLKTMGESFNTTDLDAIRAAGEKMLKLAPNIRVINDSNTQDFLLSGEVGAAFLYSSQVSAALQANADLKVVYPKEGLGFGIMAGFIPSQAPNADAAYAFMDYLLEPEVAAACIEHIGYYCTNKAAEEFISEDMSAFTILPEDAAEGEIIQNVTQEAEDLHSEIWNTFKNACD